MVVNQRVVRPIFLAKYPVPLYILSCNTCHAAIPLKVGKRKYRLCLCLSLILSISFKFAYFTGPQFIL